jgi:PE family/PPE-SVP subfamily C-terminal region
MSYVNTAPAAISEAATQLEGLASSFAAESTGAAASTTAIAPAGSDEVSILQSGVFSTYGQLYQTVSAQAQAIQQQFNQLLQQSSGSYQDTEASNQAGTAANSVGNSAQSAASTAAASPAQVTSITDVITSITAFLANGFGTGTGGLNSNLIQVPLDEVGNFASAESDLIGMGGGGLLTALAAPSTASADLGGLGMGLASDVGPAGAVGGAGGMGAAPVLAAAGSGASIGPMSVPPSWAGGAGVPTASTPVTLASQSWATAAPSTGGMGPGIAGMPAVANGGRGGSSFGTPRYGVKPKVMPGVPKPALT